MKILSPCDRPDEVELLVEAGAHALYGGVQPDGWGLRHLSANQRTFENAHFPSEAAFSEGVGEARRLGTPFHLVLNAPLYDPASYPRLIALVERAVGWGVAGLIVGDLGLLLRLRKMRPPVTLTLSTMAGAMNEQTVAFFRTFGVDRVVLPRHLTVAEMGEIVAGNAEVDFEAFVLIGKCPHEEAWCSFQHVSPSQRWPCEIPYQLTTPAGNELPAEHLLARWHREWRTVDRRQGCGLCGIPALGKAGVRHLKLVGRGGPTAGKVLNVRLVARCLEGGFSAAEARAAYQERFGRPCHPLVCYVPDLTSKPGMHC